MTAPLPAPEREPVKWYVTLGSLVAAAVVACGGAVTLILARADLTATATAVGGAVTAVGALAAFLAPYLAALRARQQVTPLGLPRDFDGGELIRADGQPLLAQRARRPGPQTPGVPDHAA